MAQSLASFLTEIADAIRTKKNINNAINASNFVDEILSIGGDKTLEYTNDGTLPTFLSNIAEAIRIKRNYPSTQLINAQDFAEEILAIKVQAEPGDMNYSSILGLAILGYAVLGNDNAAAVEKLGTPSIELINVSKKLSAPQIQLVRGKLDTPNIWIQTSEEKVITPTLSIDMNTGRIDIGNIDARAEVYDIYVKSIGESTFTIKHTFDVRSPSQVVISSGDEAYTIGRDVNDILKDSDPSNTVSYKQQLEAPIIQLVQERAKLDTPLFTLSDDTYEVIITAVDNANRYDIYEYINGGDLAAPAIDRAGDILKIQEVPGAVAYDVFVDGTLVKTVEHVSEAESYTAPRLVASINSSATAGTEIRSEYDATLSSYVYVIAVDTTGTYQDSDSGQAIHVPSKLPELPDKLNTPNIWLEIEEPAEPISLVTPEVDVSNGLVTITTVDNADTYHLEINDLITNEITEKELSHSAAAGESWATGITIISSQCVRVWASDSTGEYLTSPKSIWVEYKAQLNNPTITSNSRTGVVSITGSPNATYFEVYRNDSTTPIRYIEGTTTLILDDLDVIKVTAKDETTRYLDSKTVIYQHHAASLNRLATPTNVRLATTDVQFNLDLVNVNLVGDLPTNATTDPDIEPDRLSEVTLVFTAAENYKLPNTVSVVGAEFIWNKSTGQLTLDQFANNVEISITATMMPQIATPEIYLAHTVTWLNEDGSVIKTEDVKHNTIPVFTSTTPSKAGNAQYTYTFNGWNPSPSACICDISYTATFTQTVNTYTITWKDYDGSTLEIDNNAPYGTTPTCEAATVGPAATAQYGYLFDHWEPAVVSVTGDATYTAVYSERLRYYKITWENYDGTVLYENNFYYGTMPEYAGPTPTRSGYTFAGWDKAIETVTGPATYTATYTESIELTAPNVTRTGDTINIEKVNHATEYDIYVNDVLVTTVK